jgi:hypothetical protein
MRWLKFCKWYEAGLCLAILPCVALFVVRTWHWPLVGDAPLMHYVVFLMDHGRIPYRDIVDINMPGTYLIEGLVIHVFGGGSLAWRIFDFSLIGVAAAAMAAIACPYSWFAAVFSASIFLFLHGRDGLIQLGQRDLMITVLLLLGYAFLFHALRSRDQQRIWATALFGLCTGMAATVKPTALLLGPMLLMLAAVALKRRNRPVLPHLATGAICLVLPWTIALAFLAHHGLHAFLKVVFDLIPEHADLRRRSAGYLVLHAISSVMLPLVLMWLPVAYVRRFWRTWEGAALLAGILFGLLSFYVQGKGYPYHRYPSEALLLLLMGIDFSMALRAKEQGSGAIRSLALAGLAFGVFGIGAVSMEHAIRLDWHNQEFDTMLQADLKHLGGGELSGHVQCLDMAAGCINTLYRMRLMQATGFLYDCYLMMPGKDAAGKDYRREFWQDIQDHPPEVFVVTSHQCGLAPMDYRYDELHQWPQFYAFLTANYSLYANRVPPDMVKWIAGPTRPVGYRIYVRDGFR